MDAFFTRWLDNLPPIGVFALVGIGIVCFVGFLKTRGSFFKRKRKSRNRDRDRRDDRDRDRRDDRDRDRYD